MSAKSDTPAGCLQARKVYLLNVTPTALVWSVLLWALVTATLAGVLWRGRWRASLVLPLYLLAMCLEKPPMWLWPDRFYTWGYWLGTELLEALLRLVLAVELLLLAFGRLPVGRRRAGATAAAILLVATGCFALAPVPPIGLSPDVLYAAASLRAAQATFTAGWLFTALVALSIYYRLPLDPLHRDVAAGLALWAALQAFPLVLMPLDPYLHLGREGLQRIIAAGFTLAWARAAWHSVEPSPLSPRVLRILQPWRAT